MIIHFCPEPDGRTCVLIPVPGSRKNSKVVLRVPWMLNVQLLATLIVELIVRQYRRMYILRVRTSEFFGFDFVVRIATNNLLQSVTAWGAHW